MNVDLPQNWQKIDEKKPTISETIGSLASEIRNDDNINVNDGSEKSREQPEVIEIDNLTDCTTYRTS